MERGIPEKEKDVVQSTWYSEQEDRIILDGIRDGLSAKEIAEKLPGRSVNAIKLHGHRVLGVSFAQRRDILIPESGYIGVRIPNEDQETYRKLVDQISEHIGGSSMVFTMLNIIEMAANELRKQQGLDLGDALGESDWERFVSKGSVIVPSSGRIGFTVPERQRERQQSNVDLIAEEGDCFSMTEVVLNAIRLAAKVVRERKRNVQKEI